MDDVKRVTIYDMAKRVNDMTATLQAVNTLKYHDKNFLCNKKVCNNQQREYLAEIRRISASIMDIAPA